MPSGQEHGVLRNCGLISSSPFVARRLFQPSPSAGVRQNSPMKPWVLLSCLPLLRLQSPSSRLFESQVTVTVNPHFFFIEMLISNLIFLLKLKYPIISCWNAHSRPWNLRLTSELRGFVVGIPGPGASCARRRVAFKRPCSRPGDPHSFEAQLGDFKHVN